MSKWRVNQKVRTPAAEVTIALPPKRGVELHRDGHNHAALHRGVRRESLNKGILMQAMKRADCHDMQPIPEFDSTGNAIDRDYLSSSEALQILHAAV